MKKTWTALTALLVCASMTAPAFAAGRVVIPTAKPEMLAVMYSVAAEAPVMDGLVAAEITSSLSKEMADLTPALDGMSDTACTFTASEEKDTVSVFVTSYAPYTLSAVTGMFGSDVPEIKVYGSDDYTQTEWHEIALSEDTAKINGFTVINAAEGEEVPAYRFYRIDMTAEAGASFSLKELAIYRPAGKLRAPIYNTTDGVDATVAPIGYRYVGADMVEAAEVVKKPAIRLSTVNYAKT